MRSATLALLALMTVPALRAQLAPLSLSDSLVEIRSRVSVFFSDELIVFRADGSYQDIVNLGYSATSADGTQTFAPYSGTYVYSHSPVEDRGTITFTGGSPRAPITFGVGIDGEGAPSVDVYPRNAMSGAVNVSNNSWITAAHPTTPGFVVQGSSPRWVLIRGAGPSLSSFGVPSPVAKPILTVESDEGLGYLQVNVQFNPGAPGTAATGSVNAWSSDPNVGPGLQVAFGLVGAFQFLEGSGDCAGLLLLPPGAYILQGTTAAADGELLTEVYILPYGN